MNSNGTNPKPSQFQLENLHKELFETVFPLQKVHTQDPGFNILFYHPAVIHLAESQKGR